MDVQTSKNYKGWTLSVKAEKNKCSNYSFKSIVSFLDFHDGLSGVRH